MGIFWVRQCEQAECRLSVDGGIIRRVHMSDKVKDKQTVKMSAMVMRGRPRTPPGLFVAVLSVRSLRSVADTVESQLTDTGCISGTFYLFLCVFFLFLYIDDQISNMRIDSCRKHCGQKYMDTL